MQEELHQKISTLVDGELETTETLDLLKKIQENKCLMDKMCRYHAISRAMKTDFFHQIRPDFSRSIFQQIQQEPNHFLPSSPLKPAHSQAIQPQNDTRINRWYAVAASLVAVAVLVWQGLPNRTVGGNVPASMNTAKTQSEPPPITLAKATPQDLPQQPDANPQQRTGKPLTAQFNAYLQAHNSSVYTNGEANFQPYAQVTAYGQK